MKRNSPLICTVDIGNTTTSIGIYTKKGELKITFSLSSNPSRTHDEYAVIFFNLLERFNITPDMIEGFCISSVVPQLQGTFENLLKKYFPEAKEIVLEPGVKTGIAVMYNPPSDVGADRIANAVGVWEKYGKILNPKKPLVVVDFGTAITFDCISPKGEYLGGAIFPGIFIAVESLFKKTAKLPAILVKDPESVIGKSTTQSIQSGIVFGYASMIDGMIEKISSEFKSDVFSVATGGYSALISKFCKRINKVDETITLFGLFCIYMKNIHE